MNCLEVLILTSKNYYKVDDRVRRAWVVVLNYEDNFDGDVVKRYTEGKYSYFVDATTGEIIGGARWNSEMDFIKKLKEDPNNFIEK